MDTRSGLSINLVKKKGTPSLDVFLHWAITGGRFIVILTETIALAAFLYRFTLDRQIVDLNDQINQRQKIVAAYSIDEALYRNLQDRLTQTEALTKTESNVPVFFSTLLDLSAKREVTVSLITVGNQTMHIQFTTGSLDTLKGFITDLSKIPGVGDVSLDRIDDRVTTAQLEAEVTCTLTNMTTKVQGLAPIPVSGEGSAK